MLKVFVIGSALGATAVGGYFAYSYWNPEAIAKRQKELEIKKFKEALDYYEKNQDNKKVHHYLKEEVCKGTNLDEKITSWCGSINENQKIRDLVQGLNNVNGKNETYDKTLSMLMTELPLEGQQIPN